jgi:hypothetical protein
MRKSFIDTVLPMPGVPREAPAALHLGVASDNGHSQLATADKQNTRIQREPRVSIWKRDQNKGINPPRLAANGTRLAIE